MAVKSGISSVSALLRKSAYVFLLVAFACFILYAGAVQWNLDEMPQPIEKVALAVSVVAFVLGVVCAIGAGPEAFGCQYSPERRRRYNRSAYVSVLVTLAFGLLGVGEMLRRDYGLQELFRALLPWLLLAGVTALVGGLGVVVLRSLADSHNANN